MTYNGWTRLYIVLEMLDPYDYDEFARICETEKIPLLSLYEFATKSGLLQVALRRYSEMPVEEAYMKIVQDANAQHVPQSQASVNNPGKKSAGCSSCGGQKEDKPLPTTLEQIWGFMTGAGKHIISGAKNVDEEAFKKRFEICDLCENMRADGKCAKCGCPMKIKAYWEEVSCPTGKW